MNPHLSLASILDELKSHLIQQHTGTFFIASSDNTSARFGINKGEIIFCCCQRFNGREAVQAVHKITAGKFSFSASLFPFHDKSKVNHDATLKILDIHLTSDKNIQKEVEEAPKIGVKTHVYRGQVIEKSTSEKSENKNNKKTSQRYYRGQPLND